MSIIERAKRISLKPQSEWPVIAAEPASAAGILSTYVVPLAAIGPVALVIGLSIVGVSVPFLGTYRAPLTSSIAQAALSFVMILVGVGVMSLIAAFLAPSFGGRRDAVAALKLVSYSYTPAFVAGILGLVPALVFLQIFAAVWALYVFYRGTPALALSTRERAAPFTAACVVCSIVLSLVFVTVSGAFGMTTGAFANRTTLSTRAGDDRGNGLVAGMVGAALGGGSENTEHAKKMIDGLAAAGKEERNAERSGDQDAQAQAAFKMIRTLVHGGAAPVTPIAHDALRALLPRTVAGLPRTTSEGSSGSFSGIAGSSATATYGRSSGPAITLTVADLGNMSGLAAAANFATTMHVEHSSDTGYEKNLDVDGRRVHETWTNDGKRSDLTQIVENRYAVSVASSGVDIDAAVNALRSVDMAKFQALGARH